MPNDNLWKYYYSLEEQIESFSSYIEFCEDNFNTYSIKIAQMLLVVGSEVDIICKEICKKYRLSLPERPNINDYRIKITDKYPWISDIKIILKTPNIEFFPWDSWKGSESPTWWSNYNLIKHTRLDHYKKANLNSLLESFSGLLSLHLLFQMDDEGVFQLDYPPKLFKFDDDQVESDRMFWGSTGMQYTVKLF